MDSPQMSSPKPHVDRSTQEIGRNSITIRCGYEHRQCVYLEINQSLHEALGGFVNFSGSLDEFLTRCCPTMEETLRSDHGADILGVLHYLHVATFLTICRHPIRQFNAAFTVILYPTAFPMIEVEPSHTIHNHRGRRQGGHQ